VYIDYLQLFGHTVTLDLLERQALLYYDIANISARGSERTF
jgi:hypothetical protein